MSNYRDQLVAHRGDLSRFPENSLQGFEQLIDQGAKLLELDLQMTADNVPVLHHDKSMKRILGVDRNIGDTPFEELSNYPFISKKNTHDATLVSLEQFVQLLEKFPQVTVFVEIKVSVRQIFGTAALDKIIRILQPVVSQCRIISFSYKTLSYIQLQTDIGLGYVLPDWSYKTRLKAEKLQADYLVVDYKFMPQKANELWPGKWDWMVYVIDQVKAIRSMEQLGVRYLETNRYIDLFEELNQKEKLSCV